jgi:biopolymer transport protein ExbD/biopolymer transport protein TolR
MGAFRTRKSGNNGQPEPEINVTPLVDVVLVLLIIFMVITPALNEGEHVELPEILNPDKKKELEPIEVTMATNGVVIIDKERIESEQLRERLTRLYQDNAERKIMLKADSALPYKKLRETFAMVQEIGFRGVSLKVLQKKGRTDA